MLEVTSDDIAALSDEDLRTLVGLLCESEARLKGISTATVTWGGNQNARDGGIDVRVTAPTNALMDGYLPRHAVGMQAKKTDFTPTLITNEMRPSGTLRHSIEALVQAGGAYIIVSSGTDASDSAFADRLKAMRDALGDADPAGSLLVDFYDRNRLATWVRAHAGLVVWLRNKVGRVISGWKPYDAWAFSPDGIKDEFLMDDDARLYEGMRDQNGIPVSVGVERMRLLLRAPRNVVRLVGLSGVGKTRLVQALFDARISENALEIAQAIYTDMSDNPDPQPIAMAHAIINSRQRAVIVVDNCAPELHRRLSELCRTPDSTVSIITVEYDIRDDEPEGTEVFRLEPSSPKLVTTLIERRFPEVSEIDARTIGTFSGGNLRVGIALANTLERNETLAGLRDEELFVRLFHQRHNQDGTLLAAAQACSLLYSFQGEELDGEKAELPLLGNLVGLSARDVFRSVDVLRGRSLVQRRGPWRAVLPHAIANRLAAMALSAIPLETIEAQFATDRTMRSFSRRLGYLHESPEAVSIAKKWLAPDGQLGNAALLSDLGEAMFTNIAPVSPDDTLSAIERTLAGSDAHLMEERYRMTGRIAVLLRSLAYDAGFFERCTKALITLALGEPEETSRIHAAHSTLKGLFFIVLSGTLASVEQRLAVVTALLRSDAAREQNLGITLLDAMLEASHFSSGFSFEFGAWPRDYGLWPKTSGDTDHWYLTVLSEAFDLAGSDLPVAGAVRETLASNIRGLWYQSAKIRDKLDEAARIVNAKSHWQSAWISLRVMLAYPRDKALEEFITRLKALEQVLRPANLVQNARTMLANHSLTGYDIADAEPDEDDAVSRYDRANKSVQTLGSQIVLDEAALTELLPELVSSGSNRTQLFGVGMAGSAVNPEAAWNALAKAYAAAGDKGNIGVFCGFLAGLWKANPELCEKLLDASLEDENLGKRFVALQTSIPISQRGLARLKQALANEKAHLGDYKFLPRENKEDAMTPANLRDLVLEIAKKPDGHAVASEIIFFCIFGKKDKSEPYPVEWLEAGRSLLAKAEFHDKDQLKDYRLGVLVKACLAGGDNQETALRLCERFLNAVRSYVVSSFEFTHFMQALFRVQPRVALDVFFTTTGDDHVDVVDHSILDDPMESINNPLDQLSDQDLLNWCKGGSAARYPAVARSVTLFKSEKDQPLKWSSIGLKLLDAAPEPVDVLDVFIGRFWPRSWSGSRAAIMESRARLLNELFEHPNPKIAQAARDRMPAAQESIRQEYEHEAKRDRERDERFE